MFIQNRDVSDIYLPTSLWSRMISTSKLVTFESLRTEDVPFQWKREHLDFGSCLNARKRGVDLCVTGGQDALRWPISNIIIRLNIPKKLMEWQSMIHSRILCIIYLVMTKILHR